MPEPLVVWLLLNVGFCEVLQHTPRAVTAEPPSLVTFPPVVADESVMLEVVVVVTVGDTGATGSVKNKVKFSLAVCGCSTSRLATTMPLFVI